MDPLLEANKTIVRRFNEDVISKGDAIAAREMFDDEFVNRSAPPGGDPGPGGMIRTFKEVLRPALEGMRVEVLDEVAEGDKVTTRKRILGRHTGTLLGVAPTGRNVSIDVIDIVRLRDGRYLEHWGVNTLPAVLTSLREAD